MTTFDGVLLGTGHNALVLQAYLADAGLKTLSVDRRATAGGGLTTIEHPAGSGFLHNTHSFYHRGLRQMPWYRDLQLDQFGAEYIQPDLNVVLIANDRRTLRWCSDFAETVRSFERFDARDAARLRYWRDRFRPIVRQILGPESQSPPLPPNERKKLLRHSAAGRELLEIAELSPLEFVHQEFQHPTVKAGLLFFNGLREVDLRCPGFGHHIPALLASDALAQMCIGGSSRLADALIRRIEQNGSEVRTGIEIDRILTESNRAVGIRTNDGVEFHARQFVASSLNPQQTFVRLMEEADVPPAWRTAADDFQYNLLAPLFSLHLNLSEPPRYQIADAEPPIDEAFMVILGLDHIDQFSEITRCHERGDIPPTVMWGSTPSCLDPSQSPSGQHTAFMWEKLPYRVAGDANQWPGLAEQHGDEMLAAWTRYAPNLKDAVLGRFTQTPLQIAQSLQNMRNGDLLVGAFTHGQIGYNRPFTGAGHYRGHVEGLYLCGSANHPGGNVTGLPGYNCAQIILHDLGLPAAWAPGSLAERLPSADGKDS